MWKTCGIVGLFLALSPAIGSAEDPKALATVGKDLIQKFAGTLKAELKSAIDTGGLVKAIEVCNVRAPEIAKTVSAESDGWTIGRSSHKLRNPANTPDEYTTAAIKDFLERQAAGESAAELARAGIIEEDGGKVFRMVKAIPTGQLCLGCHGDTEVAPDVAEAISRLYPGDAARGFSAGEMRGVFTLKKPLD